MPTMWLAISLVKERQEGMKTALIFLLSRLGGGNAIISNSIRELNTEWMDKPAFNQGPSDCSAPGHCFF